MIIYKKRRTQVNCGNLSSMDEVLLTHQTLSNFSTVILKKQCTKTKNIAKEEMCYDRKIKNALS